MYFQEHYLIKNLFLSMELIELLWNKFQHQVLYLMKIQRMSFYKKFLWCGLSFIFFFLFFFFFFFFFLFLFFLYYSIHLTQIYFTRSCSFHPNVIKLIGYTFEPEYFIITKKYELDLFTFIHHPTEDLPPLLAMQLTK